VPTIVDDGFALWESRAILTYLVNKFAPNHSMYPTDVKQRAQIDRALNFDGCSLYPAFGAVVYPIVHQGTPFNPTAALPLYQRLEILDTLLAQNDYVAGNQLSIADLSTLATITSITAISFLETAKYENIHKWVERMRPQVKNSETVVDEYSKKFGEFIQSRVKSA
jgi:glutathione S-transferase